MITLYAFHGGVLAASKTLATGSTLLGSGQGADFALDGRAPGQLCRVDIGPEGAATVFALGEGDVKSPNGASDFRAELPAGGYVEVGDFRLSLIVEPDRPALVVNHRPHSGVRTSGSPDIKAPSETLALKIIVPEGSTVEDLLGDELFAGRGEGNEIDLPHGEVSRRQLRFFRAPDGWWAEDVGSLHGTFVEGRRIGRVKLASGTLFVLSQAEDAPRILCLPVEDAHANVESDDLATLLQGRSPAMVRLRGQVYRYGPLDDCVLLWGPSGSGKQRVAEALNRLRNPRKKLLWIDCGAMTETLLESELFGHTKGAFTGANADKVGLFEACQGGTLLLDEVGDMPPSLQQKLLHVIQEREVRRVGATKGIPVHFRLVTASWKNLASEVAAGRFRADLFHRLNQLEIVVPSLRERADDIPQLARHLLRELKGQQGGKALTPEALAALMKQPWHGNVRELENVLARSAADCDGPEIDLGDLRLHTHGELAASAAATVAQQRIDDLRNHRLAEDRTLVTQRLEEHQGNVSAAARSLGLSEAALRRRLAKWGLR